MRISRIAVLAVLTVSTAVPAAANEAAVAGIELGAALGLTMLGQMGPRGASEPARNSNKAAHESRVWRACDPGEAGQPYPGRAETFCPVSPTAKSSPPRLAQTDKAGS